MAAVTGKPVKVVSLIDDWAFLLSDDPTAINTLSPQALLHAVLPETANKSKIMPAGSSNADVWMLKHGNPLASVDAALYLVERVNPEFYMHMDLYRSPAPARVGLYLGNTEISVSDGVSETLPGAIIIALLNYLSEKEKK